MNSVRLVLFVVKIVLQSTNNNRKDTEVTEHDILAKGTAAASVESVPSTDPVLREVIDEDMRAYWVERGPSSCQNSDSDFSKSARVYDKIKVYPIRLDCFKKDISRDNCTTAKLLTGNGCCSHHHKTVPTALCVDYFPTFKFNLFRNNWLQ